MKAVDLARYLSVRFVAVVTLLGVTCFHAASEDYPEKSISLVVPFPAGGGSDVQARVIAKGLSEKLGKPVVVDNKPGAGSRLGAMMVARSKPDGYTLLFGSTTTFIVEPTIRRDAGYVTAKDFEGIMVATTSPAVLVVGPASPMRSLNQLIDYAREHPGELSYASVGTGSTSHLFTEAFKASAKIDILHVPYKGEAPALIDVMGGQVSMMFTSVPAALANIKAGKLRALAARGAQRIPALQDVPTMKEVGASSSEIQAWWGLAAPSRTPPEVIARLNRALVSVLQAPETTQALEKQGVSVVASTSRQFTEQVKRESDAVADLVKAIKFTLEE